MGRRRLRATLAGLALAAGLTAARAGDLRACDATPPTSAAQQDRLLQFAAVIRAELAAAPEAVALIARSGLDLARFGMRYSHAGLALRHHGDGPWTVRQLYFSCDERQPRLFDQGLAGFVFGTADPDAGHVSLVLLPGAQGDALAQSALDRRGALSLLGAHYGANAHAFTSDYQNCNQWVAELMAQAWGPGALPPRDGQDARARAQHWLAASGYRPTVFEVGATGMLAALFVPWVHRGGHPLDDLERGRFRVSMPASLEDFVQRQVPGASRLEFCHADGHVVVRRGWEPMGATCAPRDGDRVIAFR